MVVQKRGRMNLFFGNFDSSRVELKKIVSWIIKVPPKALQVFHGIPSGGTGSSAVRFQSAASLSTTHQYQGRTNNKKTQQLTPFRNFISPPMQLPTFLRRLKEVENKNHSKSIAPSKKERHFSPEAEKKWP